MPALAANARISFSVKTWCVLWYILYNRTRTHEKTESVSEGSWPKRGREKHPTKVRDGGTSATYSRMTFRFSSLDMRLVPVMMIYLLRTTPWKDRCWVIVTKGRRRLPKRKEWRNTENAWTRHTASVDLARRRISGYFARSRDCRPNAFFFGSSTITNQPVLFLQPPPFPPP